MWACHVIPQWKSHNLTQNPSSLGLFPFSLPLYRTTIGGGGQRNKGQSGRFRLFLLPSPPAQPSEGQGEVHAFLPELAPKAAEGDTRVVALGAAACLLLMERVPAGAAVQVGKGNEGGCCLVGMGLLIK